ncbi:hypothetical protein [Kitasatospora sp. NPDC088346]|uniref:hypothetical protein n=1 Tax=Kitasatospora sp. NPDC088346 TaxID=3364073 RepID=UPI00381E2FDE
MSEINASTGVSTGVRLPRAFWKVVAHGDGGPPGGGTFLLTHDLGRVEALGPAGSRMFQLDLAALGTRTARRPSPRHPGGG